MMRLMEMSQVGHAVNDKGRALAPRKSAKQSVAVEGHAPTAAKSRGRKPGRPSASEKRTVSRQSIILAGLRISKEVPLEDVSIVVVARAIDVTPALIHYYIGGRDWLTSGVMNLFYRNLYRKLPKPTGDWSADIVATARKFFEHIASYPGIAAYLVSHNQFRTFQLVAFGDKDYGVEVLEHLAGVVRQAGLSASRTGTYTHLIRDFVISTAHTMSHKLFPNEYRQFLEERAAKLDPQKHANMLFAKVSPLELDGNAAFEEGISLFMLGLERDRKREGVSNARRKSRRSIPSEIAGAE